MHWTKTSTVILVALLTLGTLFANTAAANHRNPSMRGRIHGPCGYVDGERWCGMNGYGIDTAVLRGSVHADAEGKIIYEYKRPKWDKWRRFKIWDDTGNGVYIVNRDRPWQRPRPDGRFRAVFTSPGQNACHWYQVRARYVSSNHFGNARVKDRIYIYIGDACI